MKELSIEQKAKRYDEALEKARQIHDADRVSGIELTICEDLFPELAESEDDGIRIELLNYLWDAHDDDEERARWIAWLEKVGSIIKEWGELKVRYIQDDLQEMVELKQKTEQGEQNPNPCDGCINRKGCINCENGELRETEHKPADKVKEGWTPQCGDIVRKIGTIKPLYTLCKEVEGGFSFVTEIGSATGGGFLSHYNLNDYELVKRPQNIKDVADKVHKPLIELANEHKTIEWDNRDKNMERFIGNAITFDVAVEYLKEHNITTIDAHEWLNSLKDRVQPKQRQEWSEEDESCLTTIINELEVSKSESKYETKTYEKLISWLKSLRPQNMWKPTEELLDVFIKNATDFFESNFNPLTDGGVIGAFDDKKKMIEEFKEYMKKEGFNEEWT